MRRLSSVNPRLRLAGLPRKPWTLYTPVISWTVIAAFMALGIGMTLQPDRFARTPSYANLLSFAPAQVWGCAHLLVAALLLAWRMSTHTRWIGVIAHTAGIMLTLWWLGAFVIRWLTDDATTIVNVVSWSILLSLLIRSTNGLDDEDDLAA